jgi:hypothetical protein
MTAQRDLKSIIRERQHKTGESYTAARAHVMRARAELLGLPFEAKTEAALAPRLDAVVLKVNEQSARVRVLGEEGQVTLRSADVWEVVPGQTITLAVSRRWTWRGDAYASGKIEKARVDVAGLGLAPLPLHDCGVVDLRSGSEPFRRPDPYAPLWRKLTAKPRGSFEMDEIAWGLLPGSDPEDSPTGRAAGLARTGEVERARALVMDTLMQDLRYLDGHAQLGTMELGRWPSRALLHYEVGVRIGELSLPPSFDGVLLWVNLYNRPFLRCLHGYGLALWRLGQWADAQRVFERILSLNPNDNQGIRFCWEDVRQGRTWEEMVQREEAERRRALH